MSAYFYILRCTDGSYCVGATRGSLEKRIADKDALCRSRLPAHA